jgi:hypothetical protein
MRENSNKRTLNCLWRWVYGLHVFTRRRTLKEVPNMHKRWTQFFNDISQYSLSFDNVSVFHGKALAAPPVNIWMSLKVEMNEAQCCGQCRYRFLSHKRHFRVNEFIKHQNVAELNSAAIRGIIITVTVTSCCKQATLTCIRHRVWIWRPALHVLRSFTVPVKKCSDLNTEVSNNNVLKQTRLLIWTLSIVLGKQCTKESLC